MRSAIGSLPADALAGMSDAGREAYLRDTPGRFDEDKRRIHFFSDGPDSGVDADSMWFLRLFEDARGRTIAAAHSARPFAGSSQPDAANTVVYRMERGRWRDITGQALPAEVRRDWWFRFDEPGAPVSCGPYIPYMRHDGYGMTHDFGPPSKVLVWRKDRFQVMDGRP